MDRHSPRTTGDALDLYIRTYYSMLRSSGEVRVRAFEEAHTYSNTSLHAGARDARADVAAFAYSAARLPECTPLVERFVLGQSHEQFEAENIPVRTWQRVKTRGRRRPLYWNGSDTMAAFVTSTSDIDDLVPILTAYQLEWNKLHSQLRDSSLLEDLQNDALTHDERCERIAGSLDLTRPDSQNLCRALGDAWQEALAQIAAHPSDRSVRLLSSSFNEYQRAAQRWWGGIEPAYVQDSVPRRPPVYFISSNTHSMSNLLGGYAKAHQSEVLDFARKTDPEGLWKFLEDATREGREHEVANLTYYLLRSFLHHPQHKSEHRIAAVQAYEAERGLRTIEGPGKIDVSAQVIELNKIRYADVDSRVRVNEVETLEASQATIINIDYPLGMAAYHHLSRLAQGVGEVRGIYVMGKAATLNGRVGDVMISTTVYDEHSENTYLYRNCFSARDVQPWLQEGTVLDGQKALTVRGPFLQNREYMSDYYRDGYTVLEMEAGPYLSAVFELVSPKRHPNDEIVHLSNLTPFDVGVLHYASDTPYSRRQNLLSKSLSYFGVDSTYGCAITILRRIFRQELERLRDDSDSAR